MNDIFLGQGKKLLLALLDDTEVEQKLAEKIYSVTDHLDGNDLAFPVTNNIATKDLKCYESKIAELLAENNQLKIDLDMAINSKTTLERQVGSIGASLRELQIQVEQLQEERDELKKDNIQLQQQVDLSFVEGYKIFSRRDVLKQNTIEVLRDVWPSAKALTFEGFVVGGLHSNALERFWIEVYECLKKNSRDEAVYLWDCLKYFLDLHNRCEGEKYSIVMPNVGDGFDKNFQQIDHSGNLQGDIREIVMPGIRVVRTGEMLCKCIVKL